MVVIHLLAGLPGAGKTTYAMALEARGAVRLSVDERVTARHGVVGVDFAPERYFTLAAPIVVEVRREVAAWARRGREAVVDHGLDTRAERDAFKAAVTGNGGRWRLVYFRADRAVLLDRLAARHAAGGVGEVTPRMLDWLAAHWEEPAGEGEVVVDPT